MQIVERTKRKELRGTDQNRKGRSKRLRLCTRKSGEAGDKGTGTPRGGGWDAGDENLTPSQSRLDREGTPVTSGIRASEARLP